MSIRNEYVGNMKLLYITSLSGKRINGFMRSAIVAARELGIDFTIACNMNDADKYLYEEDCKEYGIKAVHIDFNRNPLKLENYTKAKRQLSTLMKKNKYDVVHCNTPIGGVLGRICAKEEKIPYVIYQAHGFHFWKGAPIKNWLCYYPVERLLAHCTDCLLTINKEDYNRTQNFKLKKNGKSIYIHGVGVKTDEFRNHNINKDEVRKRLDVKVDGIIYVTVGELIKRKNQIVAIKAFEKLNIPNSYLLICGTGELYDELKEYIQKSKLANRIKLLGFRSDMADILMASDYFVFPSLQEGLPVALMEAMAAGLPCIVSKIRGNTDLIGGEEYPYCFEPTDICKLTADMKKIISDDHNWHEYSLRCIEPFEFENIVNELKKIYVNLRNESK